MAVDRDESREAEPKMVCVGAIAGAFGVRGEARLKPFTADPLALGDYGALSSEDGARRFTLEITRPIKGGLVAGRLSGVETREAAEALRGTRLYVPRTALPPTEEDEYYHADLIGMTVVDLDGAALGAVAAVHDHGAGDLLEIARPGGGARPLLPFTRDAVPHVDVGARVITADPPAGVFEEAGADRAPDDADPAAALDAPRGA